MTKSSFAFREKSVRGVCEKYSGVRPLGVSLLNKYEALLEFSESEMVWTIMRAMNKIDMWGSISVYIICLMSTMDSLVKIIIEREQGREENSHMEHEVRTRQKEQDEALAKVMNTFDRQIARLKEIQQSQ